MIVISSFKQKKNKQRIFRKKNVKKVKDIIKPNSKDKEDKRKEIDVYLHANLMFFCLLFMQAESNYQRK